MMVDADCRGLVDAAQERFEAPPIQMNVGGGQPETDRDFWQIFAERPDTPPAVDIDPDGVGSVIFTGGTTGRPRG